MLFFFAVVFFLAVDFFLAAAFFLLAAVLFVDFLVVFLAVDDFGADFVIEGAAPAPAAAASERILNKVSGGDPLVIFLRADLLLFIDEQKFPELK